MNADIEEALENCSIHEIPGQPWQTISPDLFTLINNHFLCVVDYHSKFLMVRCPEDYNQNTWEHAVRSYLLDTATT